MKIEKIEKDLKNEKKKNERLEKDLENKKNKNWKNRKGFKIWKNDCFIFDILNISNIKQSLLIYLLIKFIIKILKVIHI